MKKFLVLFITVFTLIGCSSDDEDNYRFEYVPVISAEVPNEFVHGQTYQLIVTYEMPNSCYSYYHFDYIYDDTSRIIKPIAIINEDMVCTQSTYEGEFSVFVEALQTEPYIFKFWQGEDDQGEPIYLTIEVPVN